ncbi:MAG: dTMP kinase [Methanothrix sp.]|nr:dTMP kinase [Methanothrix sp.]
MRGLLITLEGIDGSGKSTAARQIASRLPALLPGRRIVMTAEPTKGRAGTILRERLSQGSYESRPARQMEELFLFMADHAGHLAGTILPSLEEGAVVVSDRYSDSTAAYQGVTLQGTVEDPVGWIRGILSPWNVVPDRTLLFVLDPGAALQRIRSRHGHEKFERLGFLKEVDANFRRLAREEPERFVMIDASRDEDSVAEEAISSILQIASERGL